MKQMYVFSLVLMTVFLSLAGKPAMAGDGTASWTVKYESPKVFIKNEGQFPVANKEKIRSEDVLYAYDNGQTMIYFTKHGVTYAFNKKSIRKDSDEGHNEGESEENNAVTQTDIVCMTWDGANADVKVVAEGQSPDYFSYGVRNGEKFTNVANIPAYRKLTYKNLYPNIDVEFSFLKYNDEKEAAVEYSVIVHPGGDLSAVKMNYPDDRKLFLHGWQHNLRIATAFEGSFLGHHAKIFQSHPTTYYLDNKEVELKSSYVKNGNSISFNVEDYDHSKTIVIDPWTVTPSLPNSNKIWEIERDTLGNVYIYGGDMPMTLKKYSNAGALVWTYITPWDTATYWVGSFIVDKAGNSYITSGANGELSKITPAGALAWHNNPNGLFGPLYEYWHLSFNCDQSQLVIGGTRTPNALSTASYRGAIMNMNLNTGAVLNYVEVGYVGGFLNTQIKEVRSICASPNGNYYYLTLDSIGSVTPALAINYQNNSTYNFTYGSPAYGVTNQGISAIRATSTNIYTQNGATLSKRDITNGAILATVNIPGGVSNSVIIIGGNTPGNSGLDLDSCGNIYVGSTSGVIKYDANLTYIATYPTPHAVYDVAVNSNGEVVACGDRFATSINMSACNPVKLVCSNCPTINPPITGPTSFCPNSSGTSLSGPAGYSSYTWSNGATTQSINVTSAGTFSLTVSDGNACTGASSVTVTINAAPTPTITGPTTICSNPITLDAGTGYSSYHWSNGNTTQSINTSLVGTYTVTVTNAFGCTGTASITVIQGSNITPVIAGPSVICIGGTAILNAGSYTTYAWSTGATTQIININTAGTYTVTVSNATGCTGSASITVTAANPVSPTISGSLTFCTSGSTIINANAGYASYLWSTGATTASILVNTPGTYTITVTDANGCTGTTSANVIQSNTLNPSITGPTSICSGNPAILNAGAGYSSYLWSNGLTTQNINVVATGTYTVTVSNGGGCTGSTSITVTVNQSAHAAYTGNPLSGCAPLNVTFLNTSTNAVSYLWNFGDGNTSQAVSPTHVYTTGGSDTVKLIAYGAGGCNDTMKIVVNVLYFPPVHASFVVDTFSGCKPLVVHFTNTSTNATRYLWHFGDGGTSTLTNPQHTYYVSNNYNVYLIAYDSTACGVTTDTMWLPHYFTVFSPPVHPTITANGNVLTSSATVGNQWLLNFTPINGATNHTYTVTANGCYSVMVTDTNGCTASSDTICFGVNGINELVSINGISLYPNPNDGNFTLVNHSLIPNLTFRMFDVLGKEIFTYRIKASEAKEDLFINVNSGIYYYLIDSDRGILNKGKMVLIR